MPLCDDPHKFDSRVFQNSLGTEAVCYFNNLAGEYRDARSGRHYAGEKLGTMRRRFVARRLRKWISNLGDVDPEL